MSNFKNIEMLGLRIYDNANPHALVVDAERLEILLQSAQVVYGLEKGGTFWWDTSQLKDDTHKAILLAIEPIKKKTKTEAALELLEYLKNGLELNDLENSDDCKKIKAVLEMND